MDFFDREARSQKQTKWLLGLFVFGVAVVLAINYLVLASLIRPFLNLPQKEFPSDVFDAFLMRIVNQTGEVIVHPVSYVRTLWHPVLGFWILLATLASVIAGCVYKYRELSEGGAAVAESLGGRCLKANPSDAREKQLRNVVEEMAIASGMPVPDVYVLDNERGINSFAAGHTRDDVAIGITRGALLILNRDELQGIVAHEFSHVLNGDTRLNMRLMVLVHGFIWPTIVGRRLLYTATEAGEGDESIFDQVGNNMNVLFMLPALLLWLIGAPGLILSRVIKSAICRERERLADAEAVQFTRNPAGVEGALKKIGGLLKQGRLDTANAETASHLYFANCTFDPWLLPFTSTHPSLTSRILAIDPAFDGKYEHIMSLSRPEVERAAELDRQYLENVQRAKENAKVREEYE